MQRFVMLTLLLLIAVLALVPVSAQSHTPASPHANPPAAETTQAETLNIEFVSSIGGVVRSIAVDGNYAYIGEGAALTVLDVSNPAQPQKVARLPLPGLVFDMQIIGNYAYIADYNEGLQIVNVSDPTNPILRGTYETPGYTWGIHIVGNYAYVADSDNGLHIVDVSNPDDPRLVSSYDTSGDAYGVYVSGLYAYVADMSGGLKIIDVRDPANPTLTGTYQPDTTVRNVHVVGNYAYITGGKLQIIDVRDPANPTLAATHDISSATRDVYVVGDYAYVTGSDLYIFDVRDPTNPILTGTYDTFGTGDDVYILSNYAYVTGLDGLQIIDINIPTTPTLAARYEPLNHVYDVQVVGNYAYVASGSDGLYIVDISTPGMPVPVGDYNTLGLSENIYVVDHYAYIADRDTLQIVDVSDPSNPTHTGTFESSDTFYFYDVYVVNEYAYIANWHGSVAIVNVSDPSNPTLVGSYDMPDSALGVHVVDTYAYIATGDVGGVQIIDVSNPSNPTLVGSYDTPGWALDIYVVGNYAYVSDGADNNMHIIDISNPTTPTLIGSYDTPDSPIDVQMIETYAYVADYRSGVQIIDVSNPSNPTLIGNYDTPNNALSLYVSGDYIYVADGAGGLQILRIGSDTSSSVYLPLVTRGGGSSPDPNTTTCNDAHEPNDNPAAGTPFEVGNTQSHAFCESGDEDWLTFDAAAGTAYRIETSNLAPGTDTVLELYGRDGQTLLAINDDGGDGLASLLPFKFGESDTYAIKLRQYGNTGDAGYTYDVSISIDEEGSDPTPHPAPVFDYPSDGQVLNYAGSYLFRVQPIDNAQVYLWTFSQNGQEVWSESVDAQLSGNEYAIQEGSSTHSQFEPGAVDVQVRTWVEDGWSESASITIELRAEDTPTCDDVHEPNDSPSAAGRLEVGTTQSHAFCADGDEDWIVFEAVADATYRIETVNLSTGTDTVLELYTSDGSTRLAANDDGGEGRASLLEYTFSQAGSYAIKVRPYGGAGDPGSTYDVQVEQLTMPDDDEQEFTEQVIALTNQERAQHGCPALTANDQLTNAAQGHSSDMAINDYFSHTGLDGSSPFDRMAREGYEYSRAAENIAVGYTTPERVVEGWMNSEGHRKNILNCDLQQIGVGYYYLDNDTGEVNYKHYWTQVFGTPRSSLLSSNRER